MKRLLSILVFLPCFLYAQNIPGFLGRKNTVSVDYGLFLLTLYQPQGPTGTEFAYSLLPGLVRLNPRIGLSYERLLNRNNSVTGGLHRYTSYSFNRDFFVHSDAIPVSPITTVASVSPIDELHFRTVNTQLSLGLRIYSSYAPLNYYFELGGTSIFYSSESITFVSQNAGQNDATFNETITPNSGVTFMGYWAFGLHEFINENVFVGFDLRAHIRNLGMVRGFDEYDNSNSVNDTAIPLSERVAYYNRFHSRTNIGLGFTVSVGYVF
jgi:hypothetical protein